jgi:tetratricopeptide (TPR) repeat protein
MRIAVAVALFACCSVSIRAQSSPNEIYREAVATYAATGDAAKAVEKLTGWHRETLEAAVKDVVARHDPWREKEAAFLEAAALLHLEIGIAVAGISTPSTQGHLELGELLVNSLVPKDPGVRETMNPLRQQEIARIRTVWHSVAGSAFLSVNDTTHARPFLGRANAISPRNAAVLTLLGTAEEIDGNFFNPDDWENLMKVRVGRERTRVMFGAERLYRDALKADPDFTLAQIRLGRVMHLTGNIKEANTWLTRGFLSATEPSHQYLAAMFMGAFRQHEKDLDGAREAFETALEIAPRSQNAVVALAYVELISGRANRAQELARNYLMTPDSDDLWWASKNGALDFVGLRWLRKHVRP